MIFSYILLNNEIHVLVWSGNYFYIKFIAIIMVSKWEMQLLKPPEMITGIGYPGLLVHL